MDYIQQPPVVQQVSKMVSDSLQCQVERDLKFPIITGMQGVGKTRAGQEVCRAISSSSVKVGYISNAKLLRLGEPYEIESCLAWALIMAFLPNFTPPPGMHYDMNMVMNKAKKDFGNKNVSLVIQIDEYRTNVPAINLLLVGCVTILTKSAFHVVVVLTGIKPVIDVSPNKLGSKFHVVPFVLNPLVPLADETISAFSKALQIKQGVKLCQDLQTLLLVCGGYPASMVAAIEQLKGITDIGIRNYMRESGILPLEHVKTVYDTLVNHLAERYNENRWVDAISSLPTGPPDFSKKDEGKKLSLRSKTLLTRVLLYSLAGVPIEKDNKVIDDVEVTYKNMEQSGLVTLTKVTSNDSDNYTVSLPLLAMSVMNQYLHVVDFGILDNPFEVGFNPHEKLSIASFAARVRVMIASVGAGKTCTMEQLRPGAIFKNTSGKVLLVKIPNEVKCFELGHLLKNISKSGPIKTGLQGNGVDLPNLDGTMWMAAINEEGVDGGALFSGTFDTKEVLILVLSQSKSLQTTTNVKDSVIQKGKVTDAVEKIVGVQNDWIEKWVSERAKAENKEVVVVYDLFSDRSTGPKFNPTNDIVLPTKKRGRLAAISTTNKQQQDVPVVSIVLTARGEINNAVGPALALRASIKRSDDVQGGNNKVKRGKRG
jgi:hypothetical protein